MELKKLLTYFEDVRKRGEGDYMVKCPCHLDKKPSLHITDKGDKILIWCFAGCESKDILKKLDYHLETFIKEHIKH